jgi:hypothetical protein
VDRRRNWDSHKTVTVVSAGDCESNKSSDGRLRALSCLSMSSLSYIYVQTVSSLSVDCLCLVCGQSLSCPWTVPVLSVDCLCLVRGQSCPVCGQSCLVRGQSDAVVLASSDVSPYDTYLTTVLVYDLRSSVAISVVSCRSTAQDPPV